jgi:hypothetical protein
MSILRLPTPGLDLQSKLSITQFTIPAGAGATFSNANSATVGAGGLCTFTSNAAHGLTLNPSAGVPPNYFVTFGGSTSSITGNGVLINNVFRILSIPSTTTFTFWSTISTATVTSTTVIPVFYPPFLASSQSGFANGPTQTISSVVTPFPPAWLAGASVYIVPGANCNSVMDQAQVAVILDALSTASLPGGNTPATAPTWTTFVPASGASDNPWMAPPWGAIFANGSTGTTTISVVN